MNEFFCGRENIKKKKNVSVLLNELGNKK